MTAALKNVLTCAVTVILQKYFWLTPWYQERLATSGAYVPYLKRSDRTQGTLVSPISMESIDLHMIAVITTIGSRNELYLSDCCI